MIIKVEVSPGIVWIEIPEADLRILCGCPADSVKHLMRAGLIRPLERNGAHFESGPNAILLSDVMIQNGAFCNLGEFPVLQMLYRQGMILPGHPNNTGRKPLVIGRYDQVQAQIQYIYRGNYGLISEEEIMAAGASPELAHDLMRLKLKFAFGRIAHPRELLDSAILPEGDGAAEIAPGVTIRRTAHNVFEITHDDHHQTVDLNLGPYDSHECPFSLGAFQFRREYFAVVHSGEGDGWDIRRPTLGAVVVFQGHIYLVDAGPALLHVLQALGIGVNEIEGIFHTHSHDDHFAGLTSLIQADRRIKYYATPLVRASVTKKLAALLSIDEEDFGDYFDIHDLVPEVWNDVKGLEVRPVLSPHPVETTIMFFRALGGDGYKTFAHLADIASHKVLNGMVTDDPDAPGISRQWCDQVLEEYLTPADVKKVDVGGGLIHGEVEDFRHDKSQKVILAHFAGTLNAEQRRVGSGASFGAVDVLIPTHRDFIWRNAYTYMADYLRAASSDQVTTLLNSPMVSFNPESIILKEGVPSPNIYLLLTGQVEMLDTESSFRSILSAGALLGEMSSLHDLPPTETYRALSFVQTLEIPCRLYAAFVKRHDLFKDISRLMENCEFLRKTWLFGGIMSTRTLNAIARDLAVHRFDPGQEVKLSGKTLGMVVSGTVSRLVGDKPVETLGVGDFFGEEEAVFQVPAFSRLTALEATEVYGISSKLLNGIPNVRWKLFETFERRSRHQVGLDDPAHSLRWEEEYGVNILEIDHQHRRLFAIATNLFDAIRKGDGAGSLGEALEMLVDYTMYHFAEEEALLERYGFPDRVVHAARHRRLLEQVRELSERIAGDDPPKPAELKEFLTGWIVNHILMDDRKFSKFLNKKGVY